MYDNFGNFTKGDSTSHQMICWVLAQDNCVSYTESPICQAHFLKDSCVVKGPEIRRHLQVPLGKLRCSFGTYRPSIPRRSKISVLPARLRPLQSICSLSFHLNWRTVSVGDRTWYRLERWEYLSVRHFTAL